MTAVQNRTGAFSAETVMTTPQIQYVPAPVTRNQSLQLENFQLSGDTSLAKYAKSQTQIGAKDVQSNLHSSNQSELCDVSSSWSAIRLQGARQATSTLEHPVNYLNNKKEGGKKSNKVQCLAEKSHPSECVRPRQLDLDYLGPVP